MWVHFSNDGRRPLDPQPECAPPPWPPTHAEYADLVMGSEAMMWLCAGANHQEMWLGDLRKMYDEWQRRGGKTWGKR